MRRSKLFLLWCILMSSFFMLAINENQVSAANNASKKVVVSPDPEDQKELKDFDPPIALPAEPTGYQKVVRIFEGVKEAKPGVYWYQLDSLQWKADANPTRACLQT